METPFAPPPKPRPLVSRNEFLFIAALSTVFVLLLQWQINPTEIRKPEPAQRVQDAHTEPAPGAFESAPPAR